MWGFYFCHRLHGLHGDFTEILRSLGEPFAGFEEEEGAGDDEQGGNDFGLGRMKW